MRSCGKLRQIAGDQRCVAVPRRVVTEDGAMRNAIYKSTRAVIFVGLAVLGLRRSRMGAAAVRCTRARFVARGQANEDPADKAAPAGNCAGRLPVCRRKIFDRQRRENNGRPNLRRISDPGSRGIHSRSSLSTAEPRPELISRERRMGVKDGRNFSCARLRCLCRRSGRARPRAYSAGATGRERRRNSISSAPLHAMRITISGRRRICTRNGRGRASPAIRYSISFMLRKCPRSRTSVCSKL